MNGRNGHEHEKMMAWQSVVDDVHGSISDQIQNILGGTVCYDKYRWGRVQATWTNEGLLRWPLHLLTVIV